MSTNYGRKGCRDAVWNQCIPVKNKDSNLYRRDAAGNEIYYHSYGKNSNMGWEIDHLLPQSRGGLHTIDNLQALQTSENRSIQNQLVKPNRLIQKQLYQNNPNYYEK
jgi:hypothetical protein